MYVDPVDEGFTVRHQDARQLQYSMIYVLAGCYTLSGLLYLISYWQIKASHKVVR